MIGCINNIKQTPIEEKNETTINEDSNSIELIESNSNWKQHQDSLREFILNSKESEILKNSFLQEMYIRDVVALKNNRVHINIFFDIHGLDCGAPDCYQTELYFNFELGDSLKFPKKVPFTVHEYGCIENGINLNDLFQLKEENENIVIYTSSKGKCVLVLFSNNDKSGNYAYYFDDIDLDLINVRNIMNILNQQEEEDAIIPYKSWLLSINEYENFLK